MVAEAWVDHASIPLYLRPDEYHQSFDFEFLQTPWDLGSMRGAIERALAATRSVGSIPTWTLSNHDVMRHATRYGLPAGTNWRRWPLEGPFDVLDAELRLRRAQECARPELLIAQACRRISPCGATRRNVCGQKCDQAEQRGDGGKRQRIIRLHAEEQAADEACQQQGGGQPKPQPKK